MAHAVTDDVAARLGRPLTAAETPWAQTLLDDSETIITSRVGDLDDALASNQFTVDELVMVESNSVARVLRNPLGVKSETTGPFQASFDTTNVGTGYLTVTDAEWELLGVIGPGHGAFSVTPRYGGNDPDSPWYGVSSASSYGPPDSWA